MEIQVGINLISAHVIVGRENLHDLPGMTDWQWPQQKRVHYAEDRGIRADAESDSEKRHDRKSGILNEHS